FKNDPNNQQRFNRWGMMMSPGVAAGCWLEGGDLWCLIPGNPNQGVAGARLSSFEPATGKQKWTSSSVPAFATWPIMSPPLLVKDRIIYCSSKQDRSTALHVVCVRRGDFKVLWTSEFGAHNFDANGYYYYYQMPYARMVLVGDRLFVDTHNGAMAELDAQGGKVRWAYLYESEPPPQPNYYYGYMPRKLSVGPLLYHDGVLFQKGMRTSRLLALRIDGPAVEWKRPVDQSDLLHSCDGERLTLAGPEYGAYDRGAKALAWSVKLPEADGTAGQMPPLETPNQLIFATTRGVFAFRKSDGERIGQFRGADLDSAGGWVLPAGDRIVVVSNRAATAYKLPPTKRN
ncbi:MAG TPA: PQQ-binding-like beta-propeller repeat protein, partial [Planctomycetia bacterium]|nr:PQQ-binding-like beta-propeller repeat protein [Planctomycetia bacterium]